MGEVSAWAQVSGEDAVQVCRYILARTGTEFFGEADLDLDLDDDVLVAVARGVLERASTPHTVIDQADLINQRLAQQEIGAELMQRRVVSHAYGAWAPSHRVAEEVNQWVPEVDEGAAGLGGAVR